MANRWKNTLTETDVTPETVYLNRRQLMGGAAGIGLAAAKASGRPILLVSGAPHCKQIPGIW